MTKLINVQNQLDHDFDVFEKQFKALADKKRLQLLHLLSTRGQTCVCDLVEEMNMTQSKLSYHLKILMNAELLNKETKGTWSYYSVNESVMDKLLSEQLCCILKPSK
ncbi:ArsR/SmtB family transcription factor [Alkalicoccobacillus porphyridii]|uniref:Winged helix-turn-helix transcriptional regulator n=1 Tax=Alkalicoccobacillus porphyridii TaxID=2597270 RepID=A0A553ZX70_9BACI|nr:metalloregulator ArsR/SmtB family transcription factor [Alkalicoccobacillus porphyridii]TSB46058.1 winged helix-turn-helix transcriptional regulator [Alkalicoccobacillus porphyridii]